MTEREKELLKKSAVSLDHGNTGWIPYSGSTVNMLETDLDALSNLRRANCIDIKTEWGMNWYRLNIIGLLELL